MEDYMKIIYHVYYVWLIGHLWYRTDLQSKIISIYSQLNTYLSNIIKAFALETLLDCWQIIFIKYSWDFKRNVSRFFNNLNLKSKGTGERKSHESFADSATE